MLAALCVAVALSGCGGGGGAKTGSSLRERVRRAIGRAIGVSDVGAGTALSRSPLVSSSDHFGGRGKSRTVRRVRPRNVVPVYNEDAHLWTTSDTTDTSESTYYWSDAAGTISAGSEVVQWNASDVYPITTTRTFSITAGTFAGAHGTDTQVESSATSGRTDFSYFYAGDATHDGNDVWSSDGSRSWVWNIRFSDGSTYHSSGNWNADGSGSMTVSDADGTTTSFESASDETGTGTGTVEDRDATPMADFDWTADGTTHIRYADGTSETIAPYNGP